MIFVPVYMVFKGKSIISATQESFSLFKKITLKEKGSLLVYLLLWIFIEYMIMNLIPYPILHNRDFNWYFLKYTINSTAFRYSAIQYLSLIHIYATIPETDLIMHKCMVSPYTKGKVIEVAPSGQYKIDDVVMKIEDEEGKIIECTLTQKWPIKQSRPVAKRLPISMPLITCLLYTSINHWILTY